MIKFQRIIKYCAIAFAAFIIGSIINVLLMCASLIPFSDNKTNTLNIDEIIEKTELSVLAIDIQSIELQIKKGDGLSYQTDSKDILIEEQLGKLIIKENKKAYTFKSNKKTLIVYVPDVTFDEVYINSGTGKISIEELSTKVLKFDIGAGNVSIDKLNVFDTTTINSGVGKLTIKSGIYNNLDLDLGVGSTEITGEITGVSQINTGIGSTEINLTNSINDYKLRFNKGIGDLSLNHISQNDNTTIGNGENVIEVDGGIGNININTSEEA